MGEIRAQKGPKHQVVVFTFSGQISAEETKAWNQAVRALKKKFGRRVKGTTLKGGAGSRRAK